MNLSGNLLLKSYKREWREWPLWLTHTCTSVTCSLGKGADNGFLGSLLFCPKVSLIHALWSKGLCLLSSLVVVVVVIAVAIPEIWPVPGQEDFKSFLPGWRWSRTVTLSTAPRVSGSIDWSWLFCLNPLEVEWNMEIIRILSLSEGLLWDKSPAPPTVTGFITPHLCREHSTIAVIVSHPEILVEM